MEYSDYIVRLFSTQPGRLKLIKEEIIATIGASFVADGSTVTEDEIRRRKAICSRWFVTMYKELKWASTRCLDELPKALRCELDGGKFAPTREGKNSWGADNGRDLIWLPGR